MNIVPVIALTQCTCASSLAWVDDATGCACPNPANQIFVNNQCITCDISISAKSKSKATECNCLVSTLKWNKVACECRDAKSIPVQTGDTVVCELCTSERINGVTRAPGSINICKCPNNLIWDPVTLSCVCSSNQLAIRGLTGAKKCLCEGTTI